MLSPVDDQVSPAGDQASDATSFRSCVTCTGVPWPDVSTTTTLRLAPPGPFLRAAYATCVPSGDRVGSEAPYRSWVTFRRSDPSAAITYTCPSRARSLPWLSVNAIVLPSRDVVNQNAFSGTFASWEAAPVSTSTNHTPWG